MEVYPCMHATQEGCSANSQQVVLKQLVIDLDLSPSWIILIIKQIEIIILMV